MDQQPKKRGRPRKYEKEGDRQKDWKQRTNFESSDARKKYKAEKAREYRRLKRLERKTDEE